MPEENNKNSTDKIMFLTSFFNDKIKQKYNHNKDYNFLLSMMGKKDADTLDRIFSVEKILDASNMTESQKLESLNQYFMNCIFKTYADDCPKANSYWFSLVLNDYRNLFNRLLGKQSYESSIFKQMKEQLRKKYASIVNTSIKKTFVNYNNNRIYRDEDYDHLFNLYGNIAYHLKDLSKAKDIIKSGKLDKDNIKFLAITGKGYLDWFIKLFTNEINSLADKQKNKLVFECAKINIFFDKAMENPEFKPNILLAFFDYVYDLISFMYSIFVTRENKNENKDPVKNVSINNIFSLRRLKELENKFAYVENLVLKFGTQDKDKNKNKNKQPR